MDKKKQYGSKFKYEVGRDSEEVGKGCKITEFEVWRGSEEVWRGYRITGFSNRISG